MVSVRKSSAERWICAIPSARPCVQTLVARNAWSRIPEAERRSPTTASARPYMGEESTMRPPPSMRRRSTSPRAARNAASLPISKLCQVPSPITGIASPLDGTGRVSTDGRRSEDGFPGEETEDEQDDENHEEDC